MGILCTLYINQRLFTSTTPITATKYTVYGIISAKVGWEIDSTVSTNQIWLVLECVVLCPLYSARFSAC